MDLKIKIFMYIMSEELKNSNKNIFNYINDNDNNEYNTDEENYYLNDEDKEKIEEEYFTDTVCIIQKNILGFVQDKSLPLCEYLDINSIEKFIIDNIEY